MARRGRPRRNFILGADIDHFQAALRRIGERVQDDLDPKIPRGESRECVHNRGRGTRPGAAP